MSVRPPAEEPVGLLISTAAGREEDRSAAVEALGTAGTAAILVAELVARCDPLPLAVPAEVGLVLVFAAEEIPYALRLADGEVTARPGTAVRPAARVRCPVTGLIGAMYGGPGAPEPGLEVTMAWPGIDEVPAWIGPAARALECVLRACRDPGADLGRLAVRYGSDKWGALHWYTPHYHRHFADLRDRPVRLLEIGIGGYGDPGAGGASLRMWQRYFRRGLIYGLDLFAKTGLRGEPRIRTLQGDQSDPEVLDRIGRDFGPFDIVIDDGSHVSRDVLTAVRTLFPHVRDGGRYVIEDLQTSYWPAFGGAPPGAAETSAEFLKTLIDGLHHQEHAWDGKHPHVDRNVVALHCYHNLAVLEKGPNSEQGAPGWVPRGE